MSFTCAQCFDTRTIDQGGAEIVCPTCQDWIEIKIAGLVHGLGEEGRRYATASGYTSSTITFTGTATGVLSNVISVRQSAEFAARQQGLTGRNNVSSGAIAIERRVRKALATSN